MNTEEMQKLKMIIFFVIFLLIMLFIGRSGGGDEYEIALKEYEASQNTDDNGNKHLKPHLEEEKGSSNTKKTELEKLISDDIETEEKEHIEEIRDTENIVSLMVNRTNFVNKIEELIEVKDEISTFEGLLKIAEEEYLLNKRNIDASNSMNITESLEFKNVIRNIKLGSEKSLGKLDSIINYYKTVVSNNE